MKLNKYQLGGGTEQSDQYAMLATSIQQAILRGQTPQAIYESLVARKMEQKMALQLVSSVVQQMLENGSLEEEDLQQSKQKDAAAEKALLEDQQLADKELEKDNAAEAQMNTYNQQSSDVALDTSGIEQEEEDLNSMYSNDQYGFQAGGATKEDIYNSQFGEEENKEEPFSMESLLKSTPGTQNFNFAGIQDYYMPYSPIGSSSDLQFVDFSNTSQAKYGGSHKKQFAKNVLNLLKKAEGGTQEDEVTDTNNAVQTDDLLGTVQKKQSSFVDAMGNTAKKIKIDEWFDKLKEVGDPMLDQILNPVPEEDPIQQQQQQVDQMLEQGEEYEEEDGGFVDSQNPDLYNFIYGGNDSYGESKNVDDPYFSDMDAYPEMGRGGNRRRAMRNYRRATNTTARDYLFPANRGIYNAGSYAQQQGMPFIAGTNNMYSGSMANMLLQSRDVTKTGVFGRPKEWTDYYGTGTGASNRQEEIKLDNQYANEEEYLDAQPSDYSDFNPITQMRLNSAERKMDRQTARGIRNDMDQPMEGPITLYDDIKLLKKDKKEGENWRGTPNWRQEPRTEDKVFKENNIQEIKITPKREYTDEEIGIDPRTYDDLMKDKRARKLQDGGSPEENFNFYEELENTMYDYEPDTYPFSYQIGGYLPKANLGLADTPVSYSNNPAFVGQAEVDWTGSGQDMFNTGLQPSSFWADQQSFNAAPPINSNQGELPTQYNIDPNQAEEYQTKKQWDPNALIGINRKRKNMIGTDPQAMLEAGNASANFILGKIDQSRNADSQAQFYEENFDPMKNYAKKDRIDKGDYETNIGGYRLNETGSNRLGRSKQYGGGMYNEYLENEEDYLLNDEENEVNKYKKGGEKITFMSEKQIKAFLAAGGELKFI
jgi:hypothetical protein